MRAVVAVGSVGAAGGPLRIARALGGPADEQRTTVVTVTPRARTDVLLGGAYAVTSHQDAQDVLGAAREDAGRLPVVAREVVDRSVARGLIRAAAEEQADLLVVGRRGRTPTLRASTAERLAARSPCPVVSVPLEWAPRRPLTRVGVLAPPGPEGLAVLAMAARLADEVAAWVRIISMLELPPASELAPVHIARELEDELDLLVVEGRSRFPLSLAPVGRLLRRFSCPLVFVGSRAAASNDDPARVESERTKRGSGSRGHSPHSYDT